MPNRRLLALGGLLLAALAVAVVIIARELPWTDMYWLWRSRGSFVEYPIPFKATQLLMDIGVVDANGDDVLDVFTTNHNYRQDLLIADGKGGYRDTVSAWGLDQSPEFPGMEIALSEPEIAAPGVYIYWKGRKTLTIRTYKLKEVGRLQGKLRSYSTINGYTAAGFAVEAPVVSPSTGSEMPETAMGFAADVDGELDLEIETPGVPISFELEGAMPLTAVYVGRQKISPRSKQFDSKRFDLTFQDPHGMAWADYNDDGRMDVFVNRGALGGTLKALPEIMSKGIQDQLFVTRAGGLPYRNVAGEVGIDKRGCSGRKVNWVDFNRDGLLDLFINCQDRGNVYSETKYP